MKKPTRSTPRGLRIPIGAAKDIAQSYGYDQVAIFAFTRDEKPRTHITTYGVTKAFCKEIGDAAPNVARIAGWIHPTHDDKKAVTSTQYYDEQGFVCGMTIELEDGTRRHYGKTVPRHQSGDSEEEAFERAHK
jgi:hypothetical protein